MITGVTLRSPRAELLNILFGTRISQKLFGSIVSWSGSCHKSSIFSPINSLSHWKRSRRSNRHNKKAWPVFGVPATFGALSFFTSKGNGKLHFAYIYPVLNCLFQCTNLPIMIFARLLNVDRIHLPFLGLKIPHANLSTTTAET